MHDRDGRATTKTGRESRKGAGREGGRKGGRTEDEEQDGKGVGGDRVVEGGTGQDQGAHVVGAWRESCGSRGGGREGRSSIGMSRTSHTHHSLPFPSLSPSLLTQKLVILDQRLDLLRPPAVPCPGTALQGLVGRVVVVRVLLMGVLGGGLDVQGGEEGAGGGGLGGRG
jgi:hypothetical protein